MSQFTSAKLLTSIVAIDKNGAIGCRNSLPWRLKSDMAFFRRTTTNNVVVMGRKTHDSIGSCLPNRHNLVLSHSYNLFESTAECMLVHSIGEALFQGHRHRQKEVFVIGGAATYSQFSDLVDRYLVTLVDHESIDADAFLSEDILKDFESWDQNEITSFQASPGRDDFGFRIVELLAPDAIRRQQERASLIERHAAHSKKASAISKKSPCDPFSDSQTVFAF